MLSFIQETRRPFVKARGARRLSLLDAVSLDGAVDWEISEAAAPQHIAAMRCCGQDPIFHAEGDVLTHTKMVCAALAADPAFTALDASERRALALAALLHDVEKPATRREEWDEALGRSRVRHPHHAAKGARTAFLLLWAQGAPLALRLNVFHLIAWHQKVFHVFGAPNERAQIIRFSQLGRWRDLVLLARADNRGRHAPEVEETALVFDLLQEAVEEAGLWTQPFAFPDVVARAHFLGAPGRSEWTRPSPPQGGRAIILVGPPGVGKTTYAQTLGHEVISLDTERERLGLGPQEAGAALTAALEKARVALREKRAFVWANTNMTRLHRAKIATLARDYDAWVEIRCLDAPLTQIVARNAARPAPVPDVAMAAMLEKFEPPTIEEAHELTWIDVSSPAKR